MRYAMRAASQLPGRGPTDVDNAPAPARTYDDDDDDKLILSGTVGVTLCKRNCHVNPHKIETCFRAFPKFKLINAPHLYLMQIGVG